MASLPTAHPTLSLHLTDPALTPLISSSSPPQEGSFSSPSLPSISHSPRFAALTDLTTASLTAYSSTARLGLGLPQRIIIDTTKKGPVILHSFLNPEQSQTKMRRLGFAEGVVSAAAIVDQTRETLRPLSGSTAEEEGGSSEGPAREGVLRAGDVGEGNGTLEATLIVNGKSITSRLDTVNGPLEGTAQTDEDEGKQAPLLIATVVAPSHDKEASRAMGRLEKLGVEFQKRWVEHQAAERETDEAGEQEEEEENADG